LTTFTNFIAPRNRKRKKKIRRKYGPSMRLPSVTAGEVDKMIRRAARRLLEGLCENPRK
jgi:hypothetical protein